MTLSFPRLSAALFCFALAGLNGCTVLGVVADNAIFNEAERNRPLMEQGQLHSDEVLFGQIGLEADIAIVKKIVATVKGKPAPAAKRCVMENGIRICYEQGAEGY